MMIEFKEKNLKMVKQLKRDKNRPYEVGQGSKTDMRQKTVKWEYHLVT